MNTRGWVAQAVRRVTPARYRPIGYLEELARRKTAARVGDGAFAGMRYGATAIGSAYIPKLIGIYERELRHVVEQACAADPDLVVDIGAAEGYYAVGLARRLEAAAVIAFEESIDGQQALRRTMQLNGVEERVSVLGRCEPDDLRRELADARRPLVVCDTEGYEAVLLDPAAVPDLLRADILVELHEFAVPGVAETIRRRFRETHDIEPIVQEPRSPREFPWRTPVTRLLPASYLEWAVSEWRPCDMSWLWMRPAARNAS